MLAAVLWLVYAVPAYLLWPLIFRSRYRFWPFAERFPPRDLYGWVDLFLGLMLVGYSAWVVLRPHAGATTSTAGAAVWGCGFLLRWWAVAALGRNWRIGQDPSDQRAEFVATGPYKLMRHPINAALILVAIGQALMTGLDAGAMGLLTYAVVYFVVQGRAEERRWATANSKPRSAARDPEQGPRSP
jgi:protein-S-isoprenylcysteine O-methyltransferase Ste14